MSSLYLTAVILFIGIIALSRVLRRKRNPFTHGSHLPYSRRPLMTTSELQAYDVLLEALPNHMVFPQVQVSRVLAVPKNKETYYWFNFISRLSYDFVVCRPDGTPLAAIEIDDASHQLPERQEADNRKNKATESAGVVMLRWSVDTIPDTRDIQRLIKRIDQQAD
ncbi:MAG: DUF2726 domain-containing protein [Alysiella sp.]|uniref:DUF2726 domain-containing protein n=1 Tax=Alysiella sp. TaxID=1872483 RepID=UPI0026DD424C|nr:DUF2726 domain-containing protein [Alysiella sp.]MDO4434511.1 DUF2726 domain-containing protein [Alysiella sp.]